MRLRVLLRRTLLPLALGLAAGTAVADAPQVKGPPMTALAAGELGRSSHVALGTVTRLRDVRGLVIAHIQVERWLRGGHVAGEITVLVAGPRPGRDPSAPSLPYFDRRAGVTYVLFLARRSEGEAYELENRQVIDGLEGMERVRAIEAQVALAAVVEPDERARRVLAHFLDTLESRGAWTRSNAARELNFLCGVRPDVFDASARLRIARAAESASAPAMRSWLKVLERRLENVPTGPTHPSAAPPGLPAPAEGSAAPPAPQDPATGAESPDAVLARLDQALSEAGPAAPARAERLLRRLAEPTQRAAVVDWLVAAGHASALPMLRALYEREDDVGVREAAVRAHGLLGGEADVVWVIERLANARLAETALLALARLRTPEARSALEAYAAARRAGSEDERALAEKVDHLLSPAFEAAEAADGPRPPGLR